MTARQVDAAKSNQQRGRLVTFCDAKHYYFTPMLAFSNLIEKGEGWHEFYETKVTQLDVKDEKTGEVTRKNVAVVCWRVIGSGVFQCSFNLKAFPLDSQLLHVTLLSGACNRRMGWGLLLLHSHACRLPAHQTGIIRM